MTVKFIAFDVGNDEKPVKKTKKSNSLSKSRNLPKINVKKFGPSFIIPYAKIIFNYLWLAFIKPSIF